MRRSSLRHRVAIARNVIGIAQPEFSRLVGIPESTLAKIESLRLPLSKGNAIRIADQTGVSMRWLLDGPMGHPIADELLFRVDGEKLVPFTRELFEQRQAQIAAGDSTNIVIFPQFDLLEAVATSAVRRGQQRMFNYKVLKAIDELRKEFGP